MGTLKIGLPLRRDLILHLLEILTEVVDLETSLTLRMERIEVVDSERHIRVHALIAGGIKGICVQEVLTTVLPLVLSALVDLAGVLLVGLVEVQVVVALVQEDLDNFTFEKTV